MHDATHPLLDQVQALGTELRQGHLDAVSYLHQLARRLRLQFKCSQVSAWRLCVHAGVTRASCLAWDCDDRHAPARAAPEAVEGHPAYFEMLRRQGFIASADTHVDEALGSVRARYLQPGAPRALLDVAFTVNGHVFGVLCCEELSRPRHWSAEELKLLRRVGSRVALHLKALEGQPSAPAREAAPDAPD
ncbi:MAG: GAF domain-containing protein [Burkholderiales bacterium]|nr:MAG: GAF domain-containing protein [Burkholderiales bacterium]